MGKARGENDIANVTKFSPLLNLAVGQLGVPSGSLKLLSKLKLKKLLSFHLLT
jgi:hypothetical protein